MKKQLTELEKVFTALTNFFSTQVLVSNKDVEGKVPHTTAQNKNRFSKIMQCI